MLFREFGSFAFSVVQRLAFSECSGVSEARFLRGFAASGSPDFQRHFSEFGHILLRCLKRTVTTKPSTSSAILAQHPSVLAKHP